MADAEIINESKTPQMNRLSRYQKMYQNTNHPTTVFDALRVVSSHFRIRCCSIMLAQSRSLLLAAARRSLHAR